jgi:hypothetical protein
VGRRHQQRRQQCGNDIVGRIFDAEGNALGGGFQLNVTSLNFGESNPAVAALADGAFVVAYEANDPMGLANINYERFSAAGTWVNGGTIAIGFVGNDQKLNPSIAVLANGDFVVSYEQVSGSDRRRAARAAWRRHLHRRRQLRRRHRHRWDGRQDPVERHAFARFLVRR